jgi:aspartyl protease family protein
MHIKRLILIAMLTALSGSVYAESKVYKCKNAQGGISYQDSACAQSTQPVSSWATSKHATRSLVLKAKDGGHFFVDSQINAQTVVFMIDTGASFVSIPQSVASAAQLSCQTPATTDTANGAANGCTATISALNIGPFLLREITVLILPNLAQPVLGMNALKQFNITQENDEMRITGK